MKAIPETFGAH